jgi:multidrug resistance efflux pump
MFASKKHKEANRFYLLPSMGRSNRKHHREVLLWALVVGLICAAIVGFLIWFMNGRF